MPSPSTSWPQWNVRLSPDLSARLRAHLASPTLVGLPRGALMAFFTEAIRRELDRQGAPAAPVGTIDLSTSPDL